MYPDAQEWFDCSFNMRAEVRTASWNGRHAKGTEEWFGWSYTFADSYIIDQKNQWLFFHVHPGIRGVSPNMELTVIN